MPKALPILIGRRERVRLPEWGVGNIRAKVDTGARTSAIDVAELELLDEGRVRFALVVRRRPKRKLRWLEADVARHARVRPSSGIAQERVVCETIMELGGVRRLIEISLVCRKGMLCRMLLGRTALNGRFVVDPSRKDLGAERIALPIGQASHSPGKLAQQGRNSGDPRS